MVTLQREKKKNKQCFCFQKHHILWIVKSKLWCLLAMSKVLLILHLCLDCFAGFSLQFLHVNENKSYCVDRVHSFLIFFCISFCVHCKHSTSTSNVNNHCVSRFHTWPFIFHFVPFAFYLCDISLETFQLFLKWIHTMASHVRIYMKSGCQPIRMPISNHFLIHMLPSHRKCILMNSHFNKFKRKSINIWWY